MKELSVFIDESGDFGEQNEKSAYYLVTFVFHDQNKDITKQISKLESSITNSGFDIEYIHAGPIVRRENIFSDYSIDDRRKLFYKMLNFVNSVPITCMTVAINRKDTPNKVELSGKLAKSIMNCISQHQEYFQKFQKVIVYYDNGQIELSSILNAVFSTQFPNVEFKKADQQEYRLLQAADFICYIELLEIKQKEHRLSRSEEEFFYKPQELKKTFIKSIDKKHL